MFSRTTVEGFSKNCALLLFFLGSLAALVTVEIGLRFVHSERRIRFEGHSIPLSGSESRQFLEGLSIAHWTDHGSRGYSSGNSTNRPIMVIGDSFVVGKEVNDSQLLSSVLQNQLRANNLPIDVFSYGVPGGNIADYVADADRYNDWFSPTWTVVVLEGDDFTASMFRCSAFYYSITPEMGLQLQKSTADGFVDDNTFGHLVYSMCNSSSLLYLSSFRSREFLKMWHEQPPMFRVPSKTLQPSFDFSSTRASIPPVGAQLLQLQHAYKGRLTIFYRSPVLSATGVAHRTLLDDAVEHNAHRLGISFVSMESTYREAQKGHLMPNGFSNTQPFVGHWNAVGHRLAASAVAPVLFEIHDKYGLF